MTRNEGGAGWPSPATPERADAVDAAVVRRGPAESRWNNFFGEPGTALGPRDEQPAPGPSQFDGG